MKNMDNAIIEAVEDVSKEVGSVLGSMFAYGVSYERKRTKKLLELIQARCGTPDAAEGCRNILKAIEEFQK